ncbi:MAG TPA: prenyltransferase/squalene oxidase repeat-containing protein [Phycisphaerae bacterium]|nr:prenyltransferase/squalene oxidase repeat-containing protein [Phycisphaerae bacterium]HNU46963.1 prenyltransferase/squalene oxidase repeat-containing protein [Phycisphaerae bacterium]
MSHWLNELRYDPIAPLMCSGAEALVYHVRRDLLAEQVEPIQTVWDLPEGRKILRRQQEDGSFKLSGKRPDRYPPYHYALAETWKQFRYLVEQFGFTKGHLAAQRAAEFLLSCQAEAGDIRGMLANQYATYYTGAILGLLIKAGYGDDPRIEKGMQWLLSMRQADGGWTIAMLTHRLSREETYRLSSEYAVPLEPDRSQPFSHTCTGMVLRAFAVHPRHRRSVAARRAANLLKGRFFQPDSYSSYKDADYWVKFQYPFWWNHLVAALDSLSLIGVPRDDPDIQRGLDWLIENQEKSGLWRLSYAKKTGAQPAKANEMRLWITLAICRILKRYFG